MKLLIHLFGTSKEYSKLPSIVKTTIAGFHATCIFFAILCGFLFEKVKNLKIRFQELDIEIKYYLTTQEQQNQNLPSEEIPPQQL